MKKTESLEGDKFGATAFSEMHQLSRGVALRHEWKLLCLGATNR